MNSFFKKSISKLTVLSTLSVLAASILVNPIKALADENGGIKTPQQVEQLKRQEQEKIEKYQKANADAEVFNKNGAAKLDDALKAAKPYENVLKIVKNDTQEIHVTPSEYWQKKTEVQKNYNNFSNNILDKVKTTKDLLNEAKKQFDLENTTSLVDSSTVVQSLKLADEWQAKVAYKIEGAAHLEDTKDIDPNGWTWGTHQVSGIPQGKKLKQYIFAPNGDKPQTYTINVTTTNLKNSSYKGKKITKIVAKYKIQPNAATKPDKIAFFNNPMSGVDQQNGTLTLHYEFYDEDNKKINFTNHAYISVGSLNNYQNFKDHYEYAKVLSGGKALGLMKSSVTVHDNDYLYSTYPNSESNDDLQWVGNNKIFTTNDGLDYIVKRDMKLAPEFKPASEWDTGWANPNAYYGAGLIRLEGDHLDLEVGLSGYQHFTTLASRDRMPWNSQWYNIATYIPETPYKDKLKDNYNYYKLIVDKPELNVIPNPTKDVAVGNVDGQIKDSANNKTVLKGQNLTYTLNSGDLPADRKEQSKLIWKDTLPNEVTYKSTKVETVDGKDISNEFTISAQRQAITIEAKPEYLTKVNQDKTKKFALAVPHIYVTTNKANSIFKNSYTILVNSGEFQSNEVTNKTPEFTTKKQVFDNDSKDINKQLVRRNQTLNYVGDLNLINLNKLAISDELVNKGVSLTDNFDVSRLEVQQATKDNLKVYLADNSKPMGLGQEIDSNDYKVTWTNSSWTVTLTKDKPTIEKYAGKNLRVLFSPKVKRNATDKVVNKVIPNYFGETIESNLVENPISNEVIPETGSHILLGIVISVLTLGSLLTGVIYLVKGKNK